MTPAPFKRRSQRKLQSAYPLNGNCPVIERAGDGDAVGRCDFALYGTFCPRHGNLTDRLAKAADGSWEPIDEQTLPSRETRDFGPAGLFDRPIGS